MHGIAEARAAVRDYYSAKVRAWGATPAGVDWRDGPSQQLRLLKLLRIAADPLECSWNDLGCGYGAMLELLAERHGARALDYVGIDLSAEMIAHAGRRFGSWPGVRFVVGERCDRVADYTVASGIFNVQLGRPRAEWEALIEATLRDMVAASALGAAVNFRRLMAERDVAATELYGATPERWASFCAGSLAVAVEVVSGYGMAEFTVLLRKAGQ